MKALLALAGLLVVAGVAAVLVMSSTSDDPGKPIANVVAGSSVTSTTQPSPSGTVAAPSPSPSLPLPLPVEASPPGVAPIQQEYMIGDVKVRDHRTGEHKQMDLPPNIHPANGPSLPSDLTHDISQQVKNKMFACAKAMPREIRGDKPKVDGQLQVAIKAHVLSITSVSLQVRDINDAVASDALATCVQQTSAALTAVAKDQADLADYGISLTFAIP